MRWRLVDLTEPGKPAKPRNKLHAEPTEIDGIRFASKKEALRYSELKIMHAAGEIGPIELQPKFPLGTDGAPVLIKSKGYPNGRRAAYYADFRYYDKIKGAIVVEDTKGYDTALSRLKRAIVEAQYKIEVVVL